MKKVYWDYGIGRNPSSYPLPDDYVEIPKKFRTGYDTKYDHSKCPAWKKWGDNCWVINQPFDLGMQYDDKNRSIKTDMNQDAYNEYFHIGERWLEGEYPEIQMQFVQYFWTRDKDVWVEQIPHPLLGRYGLELIPATFPVSVWFRPLVMGAKIIDKNVNLFLPKGTPLCYVKFYSKRSDANFVLEKKALPTDLKKQNEEHSLMRYYTKFKVWDLIMNRVKKESKCPLKF